MTTKEADKVIGDAKKAISDARRMAIKEARETASQVLNRYDNCERNDVNELETAIDFIKAVEEFSFDQKLPLMEQWCIRRRCGLEGCLSSRKSHKNVD